MNGLKRTRKTTGKTARELELAGIHASPDTVGRLLRKMKFSLKVNHKKIGSGIKNPPKAEDRNGQFEHIEHMRKEFAGEGLPIISVDAKKKEQTGNFRNDGATWQREAVSVKDHDFPSDAKGKAVPYGIYDVRKNRGTIFLGTSRDTPSFAVDSIESWWQTEGKKEYPNSDKLLILADSGGSNSIRSRVWKYGIQEKLCNRCGLSAYVCHYPPGSSKWNPIEHRLFSEISKNWAGRPLDSYETALKYARTTKTVTGLQVTAHFVRKKYKTGEKVSDKQMSTLSVKEHEKFPKWNYILTPSGTDA